LPVNGVEKPVPEMCTERRFQYYHFPNRSMYKAGRYRRILLNGSIRYAAFVVKAAFPHNTYSGGAFVYEQQCMPNAQCGAASIFRHGTANTDDNFPGL